MPDIVPDIEMIEENKMYELSGLQCSYANDGNKQTITYIHEVVSGSVTKFSRGKSQGKRIKTKIERVCYREGHRSPLRRGNVPEQRA